MPQPNLTYEGGWPQETQEEAIARTRRELQFAEGTRRQCEEDLLVAQRAERRCREALERELAQPSE